MTKLLEQAVATVRALSPEVQDDLAYVLLQLAGGGDQPRIRLAAEDRLALAAADAEIEHGELATADEMETLWTKPIP